jgi:putative SOS response-associated peptidase YedK
MCGRFSQGEPSHRISDYFGAYPDDDLPDGLYNVPPTETIRMIVAPEGDHRLVAARWGFRPFWTETAHGRAPTWINARAETAWDSPAFAPALRKRRCIIPAEAFYEWDRSTKPPQPYAIGPVGDGEMLALAGIWSPPVDGIRSAAIMTTSPNGLLATIHNRMPVILGRVALDAWLDPATDAAEIASLLEPAPDAGLRMWPVSTAVNRVDTDGPDLLRPIELPATLGLA